MKIRDRSAVVFALLIIFSAGGAALAQKDVEKRNPAGHDPHAHHKHHARIRSESHSDSHLQPSADWEKPKGEVPQFYLLQSNAVWQVGLVAWSLLLVIALTIYKRKSGDGHEEGEGLEGVEA